ncbi:MAG: Ribosomal large subunit pseudouridine synthase B [Haliscomenobacter sp.]|jgi:23S rRNA pseudouridine2605 synthase|nr:Ribosomal large subunit pseudouridine synthase B [Haliscomenobacter sp.]
MAKQAPRKPAQPRIRMAKQNRPVGKTTPVREEAEPIVGMRLNKYVAHCGICSRRQAADLVKEGAVAVNGKVVLEPFYQIQEGDVVRYKEKVIRPEERKVYLLLNKPKGLITTVQDERGRKTVMDLLKGKIAERVFPVGRLDRDTTGLLLLTNDGELAQKMTHPGFKMQKQYEATLDKNLREEDLQRIREGLTLDDGPVKVDAIHYLPDKGKNTVTILIHVGRNRIVRRIFEHLGYEVVRLDRMYLGGLTKKDLPRGFFRHLRPKEVLMLKHFTGK